MMQCYAIIKHALGDYTQTYDSSIMMMMMMKYCAITNRKFNGVEQ
ncbi:hypothetical protein [Orgyia pseudotsugata single capsid nuclopolyhedrovirus]|nr:hypothetical protein [Orgyia pseudotsugata single capsid nuclopolyhedrovirus]